MVLYEIDYKQASKIDETEYAARERDGKKQHLNYKYQKAEIQTMFWYDKSSNQVIHMGHVPYLKLIFPQQNFASSASVFVCVVQAMIIIVLDTIPKNHSISSYAY